MIKLNTLLVLFLLSVSANAVNVETLPDALHDRLAKRPNVATYHLQQGELLITSSDKKITLDEMVSAVNQVCGSMKVVERKWNAYQQRLVITKSSYNWQPALIKRVTFLTPDNQGFVFVGGGKSCDLASKKPTGNDSDKFIRSRIQRFIPPKAQPDAAVVAHHP